MHQEAVQGKHPAVRIIRIFAYLLAASKYNRMIAAMRMVSGNHLQPSKP